MATDGSTRERILDAAVAVLADVGRPTPKLLSAIAERAGVSRPTIYRNIGDQSALFDALLRREVEKLLDDDVVPALGDFADPRADFLSAMTTVVRVVRDHPAVRYLKANHPAILMRHLSSVVPIVVEVGLPRVSPVLEAAVAEGRLAQARPEDLLVWAARITVAHLVAPYGDDSDAAVRTSVGDLLDLGARLTP